MIDWDDPIESGCGEPSKCLHVYPDGDRFVTVRQGMRGERSLLFDRHGVCIPNEDGAGEGVTLRNVIEPPDTLTGFVAGRVMRAEPCEIKLGAVCETHRRALSTLQPERRHIYRQFVIDLSLVPEEAIKWL